jgi:hypothetical protein
MTKAGGLSLNQAVLARLTEGDRALITKAVADAGELERQIDALEVTDAPTAGKVTEWLSVVAATAKSVEDRRSALVKPLNDEVKSINDLVRPLTAALDKLKSKGKDKQLAWHRAEEERVRREHAEAERIRKENERKAFEAQAAAAAQSSQTGKPVEVVPVVVAPVPQVVEASRGVKTDYGSTSVRKVWKFEVIDSALVPRRFLAVDESAIRRAVAEGAREIEGVRIFQTEELSVKAGR